MHSNYFLRVLELQGNGCRIRTYAPGVDVRDKVSVRHSSSFLLFFFLFFFPFNFIYFLFSFFLMNLSHFNMKKRKKEKKMKIDYAILQMVGCCRKYK